MKQHQPLENTKSLCAIICHKIQCSSPPAFWRLNKHSPRHSQIYVAKEEGGGLQGVDCPLLQVDCRHEFIITQQQKPPYGDPDRNYFLLHLSLAISI